MKYISIKIEPNGKIPPRRIMTIVSAYHFFSGIWRGIRLTLHGNSGFPNKFLPITVPNKVNGKTKKNQIAMIETLFWIENKDY